jgi:hypothetical protein
LYNICLLPTSKLSMLFIPPAAIYCSNAFGLCNDLNSHLAIFFKLSFYCLVVSQSTT